jgi:hypothetical protein
MDLAREIQGAVRRELPPAWKATVISRELSLSMQSDELARGLLLSVSSALGLVGALLLLIFRSFRVMIIGLMPSIIPVALVFGLLGFMSGDVNLGTAMVAAVALGMVSDNTFHFLVAWRARNVKIEEVVQLCSGPMLATGLVLIGGFCPTMLSSLAPINQFGLLLSVTVALGLITNLAVLPVLAVRWWKRERTSE